MIFGHELGHREEKQPPSR